MRGCKRIVIALALMAHPGLAQAKPEMDAVSTVEAFWRYAFTQQWDSAVAFLDLTDLATRRKSQLEMAGMPRGREYTADDLMRRDPDMPRSVAEYEVQRRAKMRAQYPERPFSMYFEVDSATQLVRMSLEKLAARWIQAADPLWRTIDYRRRNQCPVPRELDSLMTDRRAEVYGSVPKGGDTAFVLFRAHWIPRAMFPDVTDGLIEPPPPAVAELRRVAGQWRIRTLSGLLEERLQGLFGMDFQDCPRRAPPD